MSFVHLAFDDWDRADGAPGNIAGGAFEGEPWTVLTGTAEIVAGELVAVSGTVAVVHAPDPAVADLEVTVTPTGLGDAPDPQAGPIARLDGTLAYRALAEPDGRVKLITGTASPATLAETSPGAWSPGEPITLRCIGSTIDVLVDGAVVLSETDLSATAGGFGVFGTENATFGPVNVDGDPPPGHFPPGWLILLDDQPAPSHLFDPFEIIEPLQARSRVDLDFLDREDSWDLHKGTRVEIRHAGTLRFAGLVDMARVNRWSEQSPSDGRIWHLECVGWDLLADRRIAADAYEDATVGAVVEDLRASYLAAEGITAGTIDTGPHVELEVVNYRPVSEALDRLAERANMWWTIDHQKRLHFRVPLSELAPWGIGPVSEDVWALTLEHRSPNYRNRQIIRGVNAETDTQVETFAGDGETRTFTVGFPIARVPTVTVNSNPQTVGIRALDEDRDWYWNAGSQTIIQDSAASRLGPTDTLEVSYIGMFDAVVIADDPEQIAQRQTVEGAGTGIWEHVGTAPELVGLAAGFERAGAKLAAYSRVGRTISFRARRDGLKPGQILITQIPSLDLRFADGSGWFLIDQVITHSIPGQDIEWEVHGVQGPTEGPWVKWFAELAKVPDVLPGQSAIAETVTIVKPFDLDVQEADEPNIFAEFYADGTHVAGEGRTPMFDPLQRITHLEWEMTSGLDGRRQITSTTGDMTSDSFTVVTLIPPQDAIGEVADLVWYGGFRADFEQGSGVEVHRESVGEVKTAAEIWQVNLDVTKDFA